MDIFSFSEKSNNCFASLIKTVYDTNKDISDPEFIVKRPGIKISIYGETDQSKVHFIMIFIFFLNLLKLIYRQIKNVEMNL